MTKSILKTFVLASLIVFAGCKKESDKQFEDPCGGKAPGGLVDMLISTNDDIRMGLSVVNEINNNPSQYPVLDSVQYKTAYAHIYKIRDKVLNSGKVYYKDVFSWKVKIIRDDKTLNAFCTPGGYIYVYTGLIKYLDNETQLAGVIGHEIAHADRRHSANQMLKNMGVSTLLDVLTGNDQGLLTQLAVNLIGLKFSRTDETEADDYSVKFLYPTDYDPRGAKYFFEKISAAGGTSTPEFLSTHPNPDNRVENITTQWNCLGGRTDGLLFSQEYQDFKNSLPQ